MLQWLCAKGLYQALSLGSNWRSESIQSQVLAQDLFKKKKKFLHKTTVIKLLLWCVRHKLDICAPFMFVFGKRFMEFFVVKCFTSFYIGFSGKQKTFYRFDTFYKETNTWKYRFFFFQKIFYNQTSGLLNISFVWKIDIYFPTN